ERTEVLRLTRFGPGPRVARGAGMRHLLLALFLIAACERVRFEPDANVGDSILIDSAVPLDQSDGLVALEIELGGAAKGVVMSTPDGVSCGTGCSARFAPGTFVTLTAAPDAGAVFG